MAAHINVLRRNPHAGVHKDHGWGHPVTLVSRLHCNNGWTPQSVLADHTESGTNTKLIWHSATDEHRTWLQQAHSKGTFSVLLDSMTSDGTAHTSIFLYKIVFRRDCSNGKAFGNRWMSLSFTGF